MGRVTVDLPQTFCFATELSVYTGHVNYAGHLDNGQLLTLVSEARVRFFQSLGYRELNVEGVGIVVADVLAQYRSEAFQGDCLRIEMQPADFNPYGCDLMWQVTQYADGREVARGKQGILFFDYATRKPAPIPEKFRNRF